MGDRVDLLQMILLESGISLLKTESSGCFFFPYWVVDLREDKLYMADHPGLVPVTTAQVSNSFS